jgi:hypothetical protein
MLADFCDGRRYTLPRFWFDEVKKKNKTLNSFGGRPSVMRQIEAGMRRRANIKMLAPTLRQEATALRGWAQANINPENQLPQVASIENGLRKLYNELRPTGCPDHKT